MYCKHTSYGSMITLLLLLNLPATAAEKDTGTWEGLKQMMSAEEFHAAGLDKLSAGELEHLDHWLLRFLAYDSQQVVHADETIKALQKVPVRHRIAGHFSGWDGDTVFTLDNGEVWKQRLSGRYAISLESPEVEIYKNVFGYYELKVVKTGRRIGVSRVK